MFSSLLQLSLRDGQKEDKRRDRTKKAGSECTSLKRWPPLCLLTRLWFSRSFSVQRRRDMTFRSLLNLCRQAHQSWYPSHLVSLTLYASNLPELYALLLKRPQYGLKIKSIKFMLPLHRFEKDAKRPDDESKRSVWFNYTSLNSAEQRSTNGSSPQKSWDYTFGKMKNSQALVMPILVVDPSFLEQVRGREVPLSFLGSLKRLHIGRMKFPGNREASILSAKRAIWFLLWCPQLEKAVLGFGLSPSDSDWLPCRIQRYLQRSLERQRASSQHRISRVINWTVEAGETARAKGTEISWEEVRELNRFITFY